MQAHPYANIFPLMEGAAFEALRYDIAANGLRDPLVVFEGKLLDGRNRAKACAAAGVTIPATMVVEFDPAAMGDPLKWVISKNLQRRHLDEAQRAMVAAKIANMVLGQNQHSVGSANLQTLGGVSQAAAATMLNVSERSVASAAVVRDKGAPELQLAVEEGRVSISAAADVATIPQREQREVVARGEREILKKAKELRTEKAMKSREKRLEKIAEISKGNTELGTEQRYPVIYADPPWRYDMGDSNRSIENHYPTMTLEEICALPVGDLATDDAMLYVWATAPKLAECMQVIEAWGFEYRTCLVWDKEVIGMGFYARNQHELLLVCKRGNIPAPFPGTQPSSVYRERRTEHSTKPVFYYEMIEQAYPGLPKIELFSRSPRRGWTAWGNEAQAITVAA